MIKVKIEENYESLRKYIDEIPVRFNDLGNVVIARRNVIREDVVMGTRLVIKSYRRIYLPNRIRYTFFSPSKAQRAFDYARELLSRGFKTPHPVAYIEVTRGGLIRESYFVSEFIEHQPLEGMDESMLSDDNLIRELAAYTFNLHRNNIYHPDYNVGNIMLKRVGSEWDFALVDINRMKFGAVSFRRGLKNMVTLGLPVAKLAPLVLTYTALRNEDEIVGLNCFFRFKNAELSRRKRKQRIKNFFKGTK